METVYKNNNAKSGEVYQITVELERYRGKRFFHVDCTYMEHWVAANGDTGDKKIISTIVDMKQDARPATLLPYFQTRIKETHR